jgi:hypothetical protein
MTTFPSASPRVTRCEKNSFSHLEMESGVSGAEIGRFRAKRHLIGRGRRPEEGRWRGSG